ncbi:MAG TPA: NAD(P)/FAD-dependent oxidoreductase [Thermoanaerobaculia bacterium]|nr:NAD(P)/FAD-dependent oxidoreductase [Thermoanaerobaculia bacterium]
MTPPIAIVGAGLGGCATAVLLARQGRRVVLFERAPEPGPVGAGLLVHPSGVRALEQLGLAERVLASAEPICELVARHLDGRRLSRIAYAAAGPGASGFGVARGALFTPLLEAALGAGVELRPGVEIAGREVETGRVVLLERSGTRHGPFDLAVAADGSRSSLRRTLVGRPRVREARHAALWASGPCSEVRGRLHQVVDGTRRLLGFVPTGGGRGSLFWGIPRDGWDALRARGWAALAAEIRAFAPFAGELLDSLGGFDDLVLATYRAVSLPRWSDQTLVVLGDAAHAMSPHLGQGANLALGDAVALAEALAEGGPPAEAFRSYERWRRPVARLYGWFSAVLSPLFQSGIPGLALVRNLGLPPLVAFPPTQRLMARVLAGL